MGLLRLQVYDATPHLLSSSQTRRTLCAWPSRGSALSRQIELWISAPSRHDLTSIVAYTLGGIDTDFALQLYWMIEEAVEENDILLATEGSCTINDEATADRKTARENTAERVCHNRFSTMAFLPSMDQCVLQEL